MPGWQDAPIVGGGPAAAPAWQSAPVVAPAAPAEVDQNALDLPGFSPVRGPAPVDPNAPQDSNLRMLQASTQGAIKGAVADTLGTPVDVATGTINAGSAGINMLAKLLGAKDDLTGYIHDPFLGSQNISDAGTAVANAVPGVHVMTPSEMTPQQRIAARSNEYGAGALTLEGLGKTFMKMLGIGEQAATPLAQAAKEPQAMSTAAGTAAAGAGGGLASGSYDEYAPAPVKKVLGPYGELISTLAGGTGGAALKSAAEFGVNQAMRPVTAARVAMDGPAATLGDGTKVSNKDLDNAARVAQTVAIDPAQAAANIKETTNTLRAQGPVLPTTGAMSADPGVVGIEQAARLDPTMRPKFIQNDRQVQQAAVNSVNDIAPEAATGRTFTDTANADQAARVATAQQKVADAQAELDRVGRWQSDTNAPLAAGPGKTAASTALDEQVVDKTLRPMQERSSQMYAAVDPAKAAMVETDPMIEAAQKVRDTLGDFNSPSKIIPQGLLARIEGTAGELTPESTVNTGILDAKGKPITRTSPEVQEPSLTSVGDIVQVYPELATTEQRARRAGNFQLADNIRDLRKTMDGVIEGAAANGDEAAQRALAAKQNYADTVGATFGNGPKDEATKFRKDFNLDRFNRTFTPPSQTAGRFLQPGQPEKAASLGKVISTADDPEAARKAVGDFLLADLAASGAVDGNGKANPQSIIAWRQKWGSALDLAPEFKAQVDALGTDAKTAGQMTDRLSQQLRTHMADLKAVEQNDTAFRHVVGHSPSKAVSAIFGSNDPDRAMQDIMAKIAPGWNGGPRLATGETAAHDGLKAAVREYLTEKATTSALQKTTTGANPVSFAALDTLFKQHESTLARVFNDKEMNSLQAAHKFLGSLKNLEQQSLAGSATAERVDLWKYLEVGLKMRYGGLKGGNLLRTAKIYASIMSSGKSNPEKLLAQMQFDPELAQLLLTRDVSTVNSPSYNRKLFRAMVGVNAARSTTETDDSSQEK